MEGMATLVQQSLNVIVQANGIHEDKRVTRHRIVRAVGARGLIFPVIEIEQSIPAHAGKVLPEYSIYLPEDCFDTALQFSDSVKGFQGRARMWIHAQIPGA